jgi:succinyl-CoA synthetase alpha subunit
MPADIFMPGDIGIVSRSGTLTYEIVDELTRNNMGQSTCVGIGGDPIIGSSFVDVLGWFEADPDTKAVVMSGEIGGNDEEKAAEFIKTMMTPVVGFIAGKTAPPGKRMGHAGAIVSGTAGTAQAKIEALNAAGAPVADLPNQIPDLIRQALAKAA